MGVVPQKAKKLVRKGGGDLLRDCEILVFLLAKPGAVVVHVQSEARSLRVVGAPAVEEPAIPDQDRARFHLRGHDRRIFVQLGRVLTAPEELRDRRVGDKRVDGASLGKNVVASPGPIAEKLPLSPGLLL